MKSIIVRAAMAMGMTAAAVTPALAGTQIPQVAGPSILGLVALGVVGAIVVARRRK